MFPNLMQTINSKTQEAQLTARTRNMKKGKPKHIIIKLLKTSDEEKNVKAVKEKVNITYKGTKIRMTAKFLSGKGKSEDTGATS